LVFYAVLVTICQQVAQALGEPLERLSVEMGSRAFYHYSRAVQRGECDNLVAFLVEHVKLLGLGGASSTASASHESPSFGATLKLRPVPPTSPLYGLCRGLWSLKTLS
jgi:hypothetical protein